MKLVKWPTDPNHHQHTHHWCPGCQRLHVLPDRWTRTGPDSEPTYVPSFLQHERLGPCHYIITKGVIYFQADCFHSMAGSTIPMPDIPEMTLARLTEAVFER